MKTRQIFRHCLGPSLLLLLALCSGRAFSDPAPSSVDPHANETAPQRDARMAWWRAAKFGMFIHWGLYAHYAGSYKGVPTKGLGEWIMHDMKIPVADYAAGAAEFDPEKFDADTWVSIAKAAGMKYIVMTAKHHEGFAMFHTAKDNFNIYDATPFKRDPIAEMSAACKKAGIKFGVYYSQAQDWHHVGGAAYGGHWDPAQDGDLDNYVKTISAPQVRELLTKYHPAVLWWDTQVPMSPDDVRALTSAFSEDPELIANNRLGNGVPGDTETPEQHIPATGFKGRDWETCMTINSTWGYKAQDTNFKSEPMLLQNLIDIASKGGNYLLNVGPDPTGIIPKPEVDTLEQIGAWLKVNGVSVYGTTASPLGRLPKNERMTVKGNTLYLHVFDWSNGPATLPGLATDVKSATTLGGSESLAITKDSEGITTITAPSTPDPVDTVVVLKLAGPITTVPVDLVEVPQADGKIIAKADDATLSDGLQLEGSPSNIGYWTHTNLTASWKVKAPEAGGDYSVQIEYACDKGSAGSTFDIASSTGSKVSGTISGTGSWGSYTMYSLPGTLHLTGGIQTLTVVPTALPNFALMNLRRIILAPAN